MSTQITSAAVTKSTVDSTPIGGTTPSTGAFTNGSFSGQLTAPTVSTSDDSTKAATTGWNKIGFAIHLAINGYIKFPTWLGGLVIQWGNVDMPGSSGSDNPTPFNFPTPFPNQCFVVVPGTFGGADRITFIKSYDTSGGVMSNNGSGVTANYIAIGY